ncbi:MAG TPA: DUF559 domain-containing protein [Pilimelia sp.]|nr:DUF559 domain-containing protein [Pilimelia sp.]
MANGALSRGMLRGRSWRRLLPDIYVHVDSPLDHRTWCDAVALLLPRGAAIGGSSAAYLWGVDLLSRDAPVAVSVPRGRRLTAHPRLHVTYSTLPPADLTTFAGIPVTTPLRTAFDLGRTPRPGGVVALDALLRRRLLTLPALRTLVTARDGWPGIRLLRQACDLAEPLSESPMETRLRLVVVEHGLPRPVAQHEVRDRQGRFVARVDLAYPRLRLALEYEGDHHRERRAFRHDLARLNALRAAGWTVLRFTADDVLHDPGRIVRNIVDVARTLGARP